MKKHTKIYLNHFGYGEQDFVPCEICGQRAVDIHHIDSRGMGGSRSKDKIENLAALCRPHHTLAHNSVEFNEQVLSVHLKMLNQ